MLVPIVSDVEAAGIDVAWLLKVPDEIAEMIQLNKQYREIKTVKRHQWET